MTCHVTGTASQPDGTILPNATFVFSREPNTVTGQGGRVVVPMPVVVISGDDGAVDFEIEPGNYSGVENNTGHRFPFAVADLTDADFYDCVTAASVVPVTNPTAAGTALITAADAQAQRVVLERQDFVARDDFVTWAGGRTPSAGLVMRAADLAYRFENYLVDAITDLAGWVPFGQAKLPHWGLVGTAIGATNSLVIPTPTLDETTLIDKAMTWCLANGRDLEGDTSRVYGFATAGLLTWGYKTTGQTIIGTPELRGLCLKWIGATLARGTQPDAADPTGWTFGAVGLVVGKQPGAAIGKASLRMRGCTVDGSHALPVGVHYRGANFGRFSDNRAIGCTDVQGRIGEGGVSGSNCTESVFSGNVYSEWIYTSDAQTDGYVDRAQRTSIGLLVSGADVQLDNETASSNLISGMTDGTYNLQLSNSKFWSGNARTDANNRTFWITKRDGYYQIDNCHIDDGALRVENFRGKLRGVNLIQFTAGQQIQFVANDIAEDAAEFTGLGNSVTSAQTDVALVTNGSGTWAPVLRAKWGGNVNGNGGDYCLNGVTQTLSLGSGVIAPSANNTEIRSDRSVRINADFTGTGANAARKTIFANRGVDVAAITKDGYYEVGTGLGTAGAASGYIGGSGNNMFLQPFDTNYTLQFFNGTKEWKIGGTPVQLQDFATRAALVTWASGRTITAGLVRRAAGLAYRYLGTGTAISDLAGWVPEGIQQPGHYNAAGDGSADDRAAFAAMEAYGQPCYIPKPSVSYKFATALALTIPVKAAADTTWAALTDTGKLSWGTGSTSGNGGDIYRIGGRVFIGDGADKFAGNTLASDAGNSSFSDATTSAAFMPINAQLLSIAGDNQYAIVGMARGSDLSGAAIIGLAGGIWNDKASGRGWAAYLDIQHETGASVSNGIEIAAKNKSTDNFTYKPYLRTTGVIGTRYTAGGDSSYGGAAINPSNAAIIIINDGLGGQTWNRGIVFTADALTGTDGSVGSTTDAVAINLARRQTIQWDAPNGVAGAVITSNVTDSSHFVKQQFIDDAANWIGVNGKQFFKAAATASGVNYLQAQGSATGSGVSLSAQGDDADVNMVFLPKGVGVIRIGALGAQIKSTATTDASLVLQQFFNNGWNLIGVNGKQMARVAHTASAVNYLQIGNAVTGSAPTLSSQGDDTNIDLNLTPKGTGLVKFGTFTVGAALVSTGYIQIRDAGGTLRNVMVA